MEGGKETKIPLAGHFILSSEQSPKDDMSKRKMEEIPYAKAIGSVMYAMISTRPDIAYVVSTLSRFMSNPGEDHWKGLKWLLRYLKTTSDYGLKFEKGGDDLKLEGYVDADYASNRDTRKSMTSYCFMLNTCCINWKSQQQHVVALSTTEAEFMAVTEAFKEATWIKGILQEISMLKGRVYVFSDSQSAIHLSKNPVYHERSKHIDIRMFWIRDNIEAGEINLEKVPTEENPADAGTKVLSVSKFNHCLDWLNLGPV
ncbi:secreted RxLR effector protein 161-like [Humulus lupulus]|uniref:secreted RxLR effector protein 161-like n=1 Tax=Humulus lupulus TaxID=3486 RepID=UPI002B4070F8|nr:secreted RxLR effector protein 161-like [Humulus lupulus]